MNIITKKNFFNILKLTLFMLCINLILPETFKAQNEIGNSFWRHVGWAEREDLNYYDFNLNSENKITYNK